VTEVQIKQLLDNNRNWRRDFLTPVTTAAVSDDGGFGPMMKGIEGLLYTNPYYVWRSSLNTLTLKRFCWDADIPYPRYGYPGSRILYRKYAGWHSQYQEWESLPTKKLQDEKFSRLSPELRMAIATCYTTRDDRINTDRNVLSFLCEDFE
jgi:hypothetical protein